MSYSASWRISFNPFEPERTDLSALHLQDRHTPLGLSGTDIGAMWRTILLTRRLDQKIEERLGAATEELASGITEASTAVEELRRAMEQIATNA